MSVRHAYLEGLRTSEDAMANPEEHLGHRLRAHRMRLELTQHDIAEGLERLAWAKDRRRVGVNADMVSKWERGLKRPSRFYLRLLSVLFGTTADDLLGRTLTVQPDPLASGEHHEGELLLLYTSVLDDGIAGVDLILPKLFEIWRDDVLHRRQLLKAAGAASATLGLECLDAGLLHQHRSGTTDFHGDDTIDPLTRMTVRLEATYATQQPRVLVVPLRALLATMEDLVPLARGRQRQSLLSLMGRANLLAGRVMFFDLRQPLEARAYLDLAREAVTESEDRVLRAVIFGHLAFLPAAKRNFATSDVYVSAARSALAARPNPVVSSWLNAIQSEIRTQAGDLRGAFASLDKAKAELARGMDARPPWFDFYDQVSLAGFDGYARRKAGHLTEAKCQLQEVLSAGRGLGPKQRAVTEVDLALVHAMMGDVDEGCRLASSAVVDLRAAGYATAHDRLAEFRAAVPDKRHPAVRLLDESLAEPI
jgi:transcriptional regulator with XRE-family HTH domain